MRLTVGPAEHAAVEPAGAGEHDRDVRHRGEHVGGGPRAAELLGAVAGEPAARPEDDVLAGLQRRDHLADGVLGAPRPPRWPSLMSGILIAREQPPERARAPGSGSSFRVTAGASGTPATGGRADAAGR